MRTLIAIAVLGVVVGITWLDRPSEAAVDTFGEGTVRLYSNGEVVGEWLAVGPGRVDGNTFVFPIRKGVHDLEVRISGTFSMEQQP